MISDQFQFIDDRIKSKSWREVTEEFNRFFGSGITAEALRKRYRREIIRLDEIEDDNVEKAFKLIKANPVKPTDLARRFNLDIDGLEELVDDIINSRAAIKYHQGYLVFDHNAPTPDYTTHSLDIIRDSGWIKFGIYSDPHFCSIHEQVPLLHNFYKICEEEKVTAMFCAGDFTAGNGTVYKGQFQDLKIIGINKQIEYVRSVWPDTNLMTYTIGGNHDCLRESCSPLTKRGWTSWDDIREDDEVLGINTETGKSEWQPILGLIKKPAEEIYVYDSKRLSVGITEGHRNLHVTPDGEYKYTLAKDIGGKSLRVPVTSFINNEEFGVSDDEITLVSWLLTDGYAKFHNGSVITYHICQSEGPLVQEIDSLLDRLGIEATKTTRARRDEIKSIAGKSIKSCKISYEWNLKAEVTKKIISRLLPEPKQVPSWVFELSPRQLEVFISTIIKADGSKYKDRNTDLWVLYGEENILDQFHPLLNMCGYSCNKTQDNRGSYRLNISRKPIAILNRSSNKIKKESYSGYVYCLTVPLSNFLVRDNGKSYFTGNCDAYKSAGIDVVECIADKIENLTYLGKMSAVVESSGIKLLLQHGEGGLGVVRSSKPQKLLDSQRAEDICDISVMGHYHVNLYMPNYRGSIVILPGCFESQSDYLIKKSLMPDVGGVILHVKVANVEGIKRIVRHKVEFLDYGTLVAS